MTEVKPSTNENRNLRLWEKFKSFQEKNRISQKKFAEENGLNSVSNLSQYLRGNRPLNLEAGLKFAKGLQCPLEDIISPDLVSLVHRTFLALHETPPADVGLVVKVFSHEQAAIHIQGATASSSGVLNTNYRKNAKILAICVDSNEMAPIFALNDFVFVDLEAKPKPGQIVLAHIPALRKTAFRKYRVTSVDESGKENFELVPLDSFFPIFSQKEGAIVVGVAIERRTALTERSI